MNVNLIAVSKTTLKCVERVVQADRITTLAGGYVALSV